MYFVLGDDDVTHLKIDQITQVRMREPVQSIDDHYQQKRSGGVT